MTLGNISSQIRNKPSYHAWIPIAFLPKEPIRQEQDSRMNVKQQGLEARQRYHDVLTGILSPLVDENGLRGYEWFCSDEKIRMCYPVLCAWLADHEENALIHCIKNNLCPTCECPNKKLGDWANDDVQTVYPKRDSRKYHDLLTTGKRPTDKALDTLGIKRITSSVWKMPFIHAHNAVRADLLHNVYLGILKHLMNWIVALLKKYGRLDRFNHIWENLSHFPGFLKPTTGYGQISQWQGKEMRNFGKVILGCLAASLYTLPTSSANKFGPSAESCELPADSRDPCVDEHSLLLETTNIPVGTISKDPKTQHTFEKAIACVAALVEFHVMAQYKSHNEHTIGYLEEYLQRFHKEKDVFLEFRISKADKKKSKADRKLAKAKALAEAAAAEAAKAAALDDDDIESSAEEYEPPADRLGPHADEDGAKRSMQPHFNFPKIHLLLHYMEQIREFGELVQYSTEVAESMHATFKDAYRRSNHNDVAVQLFETYTRQHLFDIHERNLKEWHLERDLGESIVQVLCRTHGVGTPSTRAKRRREELIKLQQTRQAVRSRTSKLDEVKILMQGRLPSSTINSLKNLADKYKLDSLIQDTWQFYLGKYPLAYPRGYRPGAVPRHLPADRNRLLMYAIDAFTTLTLPVPDFSDDSKFEEHKMRATGNQGMRKKGERADWVWIRISEDPDELDTLFGRNVARLNAIFKIRGPLMTWRVVHVSFMEPDDGTYDPVGGEQMTRVFMPLQNAKTAVVEITNFLGMVHMIQIAKNTFIVNYRIDLIM